MEMTEDQKEKLKKLKKKFFKRGSLAVFLYVSCLFLANLSTVLLNTLYFQNQSFLFFMTLGSTVIILTGMVGTIEEIGAETSAEAKKILNGE